jgi:hypothetical protein
LVEILVLRRASYDYIISTNIDIVTTPLDDLILKEDVFYTVPRRDVEESFHLSFDDYQKLYYHLMGLIVTHTELKKDLKVKMINGP